MPAFSLIIFLILTNSDSKKSCFNPALGGSHEIAMMFNGLSASMRRMLVLGAVLLCANLAVGTFDHGVWAPTEPTVAGVVWEMHSTSDLAVPRINGLPYLEKPPLAYAVAWLIGRLAGSMDPWTLRLGSVLAGTCTLILLAAVVRRRHGDGIAAVTALFAATAFPVWEISHRACTDAFALFFAALSFALFLRSLEPKQEKPLADLPLCLALALSFYSKNFFVWLIVLPPIVIFLVWERRFGRLLRLCAGLIAITAVVVLPWALALWRENGADYLRVVFVDNTVGRFLTIRDTSSLHLSALNDAYVTQKFSSPLFYPLPIIAVGAPWSLIVIAAAVRLFQRAADREARLVRCAIVSIPIALTLSSSKAEAYILPMAFPLFIAVGDGLAEFCSRAAVPRGWVRQVVLLNFALVVICMLAAPFVLAFRNGIWFALLALVPLAGGAWLAWRQRGKPDAAFACGILPATIGLTMLVCGAAVIPWLDSQKSEEAFFREIRALTRGCALATTTCDDRWMSIITYGLGRRAELLSSPEELHCRLEMQEDVAAIIPLNDWLCMRARFADLPLFVIESKQGRHMFACVVHLLAQG